VVKLINTFVIILTFVKFKIIFYLISVRVSSYAPTAISPVFIAYHKISSIGEDRRNTNQINIYIYVDVTFYGTKIRLFTFIFHLSQ